MERYENLDVWKKSMNYVEEVYALAKKLPKEELYGLSDQIRRAVVSIPSNIAEGYGRATTKEYTHFLSIARGSKYEVETQMRICERLGYLPKEEVDNLMSRNSDITRMLTAMINKLNAKNN